MASEAEASCESDPNFAIICAFLEKFGELCGVGTMDFVELQNMLENNQEVSPELMNIHIKLLRKTKKNVTVERWERALVNMCHTYASKDAWEIERFGYKKTRLQVKLRALKELLEMQFDYNIKFKNEVNKMTAESLRPQPLGRDKLGRAYWFQTDNNYQIRIYKEDPDEETWHLVAKDREGLLTLMNELADGDSKLSSDSALNEDSNSLSEKPFIDTGQSENSDEKLPEKSNHDSDLTSDVPTCDDKEETQDDKCESEKTEKISEEVKSLPKEEKLEETTKGDEDESSDEDDSKETTDKEEKAYEVEEVKRPILRIKSLSELMEKPKETKRDNILPDLPELTIIKKAKLDTSQITITRKPRNQRNVETIQSPVVVIKGMDSGHDDKNSNVNVSEAIEEPVMIVRGSGSGKDCNAGNDSFFRDEYKTRSYDDEEIFVSEEIEEEVMYIFGEGSGEDCQTGNEKEQPKTQEMEKSKNLDVNTGDSQNKVPTDTVNLEKDINLMTDSEIHGDTCETTQEEGGSPKKAQFFFGPGSLNIKPCPVSPVINTSLSEDSNWKSDENNGNNSKEDHENEGVGEDLAKEEESILKESKLQDDEEKTNNKNLDEQLNDNDQSIEKIEEELPSQETEISDSRLEETQTNEDTEVAHGQNETGDEKSVEPKSAEETDDNQEEEKDDSEKIDEDILEKTENETDNIKGASDNKDVLEECDLTEKNKDDGHENIDDVQEKDDVEKAEEDQEDCTQENNTEENKDGNDEAKKIQDNIVASQGKLENGSETQNPSRNDEEITKKDDAATEHKNIPDDDGKDELEVENEKSESTNKEDNNKTEEQSETVLEQSEKQDSQADKTDDDTKIIDHETKKADEKTGDSKSDQAAVEKDENTKSETDNSEEDKEGGIEEVELTTEKPEEIKDQEPGSKRKRVTRNTSIMNESVTEETDKPRKKMPVEKTKKKGQQKAIKTNDKEEKKEKEEAPSSVEITAGRSTRQTRQTKPTPAVTKVQVTAKPKGRSKVKPQSSKSDETDSPAPLESVTLMDTDNSNTATENPEKDPLAVSEEEPTVAPPTTSLTSFSFDYDPNSPAPATETIKRGLRKRGRENLEDKQDVTEKDVKRPKIRGKRSVDQSLRKSVEEKRQQVVDASSDENEQTKEPVKTKAVKKVAVKKKAATLSVSDSDSASQKSVIKGKKGRPKNSRLLKNLGVKEEDISSIADNPSPVRQSRRLAQIKIKEDATRKRGDEEDTSSRKKKKKSVDKVKKR